MMAAIERSSKPCICVARARAAPGPSTSCLPDDKAELCRMEIERSLSNACKFIAKMTGVPTTRHSSAFGIGIPMPRTA